MSWLQHYNPLGNAFLSKLVAALPVVVLLGSHLHNVVQRVEPVAPPDAKPEKAEFQLNVFSATGTGTWYPFFGTLLGWLGVALTGSDTASSVLFGSLQRITAEQTGISPILMGAANSSGGVMGKMVDAQSIVVASTATNWYGHEGSILRYVFFHSLVLAPLMSSLIFLQAKVWPFKLMLTP